MIAWSDEERRAFDREVHERWGIAPSPRWEHAIERSLHERAAHAPPTTGAELLARIRANDAAVIAATIRAVTTRETYFFRDPQQVAYLTRAIAQRAADRGPIRLWSAGCATGEEAWSLAMIALDALGPQAFERVSIVATDIELESLAIAERGEYGDWSFRHAPPSPRHFERRGDVHRVRDELRGAVTFYSLNLSSATVVSPVEMQVIQCSNVLLYLDETARRNAAAMLAASLSRDGALLTAATDPPLSDPRLDGPAWIHGCVLYKRAAFRSSPTLTAVRPAQSASESQRIVRTASEASADTSAIPPARSALAAASGALDAGKHDQSLAFAEQALALDPTLAFAHVVAAIAARAPEQSATRERHVHRALSLLNAVHDDATVIGSGGATAGALRALCARMRAKR